MAFRLTDNGLGVIDDERGITVKMAFGRFDDTGRVFYDYIDGDLTFGFQTEAEKGIPSGPKTDGDGDIRPMTVVTHIIERTIDDGLFKALGPDALQKVDLAELKKTIHEAIFVAEIDDGRYLRLVPEFKVDFR